MDPMSPKIVAPNPTAAEEELIKKVRAEKEREKASASYGHMRTIQPLSAQKAAKAKKEKEAKAKPASPPVTANSNPAILEIANNDDLNVATIARQAKKANDKQLPDDEVVISLH
jgi:hypothetical protein